MTANLIILASRLNPTPLEFSQIEKIMHKKLNWDDLMEKTKEEGVAALLYKNLKRFSERIPAPTMLNLKKRYYENAARNLSVIHKLKPFLEDIRMAGIKAAVIKGARLTATPYNDLGLRSYTDVDFIVSPQERKKLISILERLNFRKHKNEVVDWKVKKKEKLFWTYRPLFIKEDLFIEIHYSFPGLHLPFTLEDNLWANIQKIKIDGVEANALSPEYELCLLCIHVQQHSYSRLIWLTDIVEMAALGSMDWEKVIHICRQEKIHALVYYSLYLVNQLWPCSIPDDILDRFQVSFIEKKLLNFFWPEKKVKSRAMTEVIPMHIPTLFAVLSRRKILPTIKALLEFFFPPRIWVAHYYNIPPNSVRILGHYIWRLFRPLTLIFRRSFRI
jgi:hypothetical protein